MHSWNAKALRSASLPWCGDCVLSANASQLHRENYELVCIAPAAHVLTPNQVRYLQEVALQGQVGMHTAGGAGVGDVLVLTLYSIHYAAEAHCGP